MKQRKRDGFKNERYVKFPTMNFPSYLAHPLVEHTYATELGYYPKAKHHYRERLDGADEAIMFFCQEGQGTICIYTENHWEKISIQPFSIFCIPPKIPHYYYSNDADPWSIIWVHFSSPLIEQLPIQSFTLASMSDGQKREILEASLIELFSMDRKNYTLENAIFIANLLRHILVTSYYYLDTTHSNQKKDYLLTACIQYMAQHLQAFITLEDLSQKFNVSTSYLNKIFKKETGKSPIGFFTKLKMDEACKLLRITKLKIIEIAKELGYDDPYYFSRLFKKYNHMSPKAYRERYVPTFKNFTKDF